MFQMHIYLLQIDNWIDNKLVKFKVKYDKRYDIQLCCGDYIGLSPYLENIRSARPYTPLR